MLHTSSVQVRGHPLAGPRTRRDSAALTCADADRRGSSLAGEWCGGEEPAWLTPAKESCASILGLRLTQGADQEPLCGGHDAGREWRVDSHRQCGQSCQVLVTGGGPGLSWLGMFQEASPSFSTRPLPGDGGGHPRAYYFRRALR